MVRFYLPDMTHYNLGEYTNADIAGGQWLCRFAGEQLLRESADYKIDGRHSIKEAAARISRRILNRFIFHIVEQIMSSNRVNLGKDNFIYIGVVDDSNTRIVREWHKGEPLMATAGKRFGVVMRGDGERHYIRMPKRRRTELAQRILKGQQFYG
jgi:hypothetical protein